MQTEVDRETQTPLNALTPEVIEWCRDLGSNAQTVNDAINDGVLKEAIQQAFDEVNEGVTSNAQKIQKWTILPVDFSVAGGELGERVSSSTNDAFNCLTWRTV